MSDIVLIWFRRDLRLNDHTALCAALDSGARVVPVFVVDPALLRGSQLSPSRLAFLLAGLRALDERLRELRARLIVRTGEPVVVLSTLVAETGAVAVYANRDYTPFARLRDERVARALNVPLHVTDDGLIHPPEAVVKADGSPYTVFTPFFRAWSRLPAPVPDRRTLRAAHFADTTAVRTEAIPEPPDLRCTSVPLPPAGEVAASRLLSGFTAGALFDYGHGRNRLSGPAWAEPGAGTSALSPYLRFGMISPRQALAAARAAQRRARAAEDRDGANSWVSELGWREFYASIVFHFPHVLERSFRPPFDHLSWRRSAEELDRWRAGMTGFPVVDAAMRQLIATGWMHNRARMIVASFLTKDLLHHWSEGETFFMQHLLDGDPASNNGGWQWAAGTGTDAQPFFRIFNPVLQSRRFDPNGAFIRAWVPELRDVPTAHIHAPWELATPPAGYPPPMVDHAVARHRALAALNAMRSRP